MITKKANTIKYFIFSVLSSRRITSSFMGRHTGDSLRSVTKTSGIAIICAGIDAYNQQALIKMLTISSLVKKFFDIGLSKPPLITAQKKKIHGPNSHRPNSPISVLKKKLNLSLPKKFSNIEPLFVVKIINFFFFLVPATFN